MSELREVVARASVSHGGPDHRSGRYWITLDFSDKAAWQRARNAIEGRIAPEVAGDVVNKAVKAVDAAYLRILSREQKAHGVMFHRDHWRELVEAAAPIIAADAERRVREECAQIADEYAAWSRSERAGVVPNSVGPAGQVTMSIGGECAGKSIAERIRNGGPNAG